MKLSEAIAVNGLYTRAVRLEREHSEEEILGYIPTQKALKTLSRISETINHKDHPRAWSLVGPYGSGKSSFALYLSELFKGNQVATKPLKNAKATQILRAFGGLNVLPVLLTGSPEPLGKRLLEALYSALVSAGFKANKTKANLLHQIEKYLENGDYSTTEVLGCFEQARVYLKTRGSDGLLLVLDELGKFLEFEARSYSGNDIYLLQGLAELSYKGDSANLYLVVLLHRSIDQHAHGLGESLKQEWSKIQGRFEEIPYIEGAEQILQIVSKAIEHKKSITDDGIRRTIVRSTGKLSEFMSLDKETSKSLFESCYPLHPLSALLLPLLCNKISQNERTLFSYLGSEEDFGFRRLLDSRKVGEYIYPWDIYDYFVSNQTGALGDHLTHRRWVEVVTAVDRAAATMEEDLHVLKTIGLLNIVASQGSFKASEAVIGSAITPVKLKAIKKRLIEASLIVHRKFNDEYRVWQGSDFDIDGAIQQAIFDLGNYSISAELNAASALSPIVARRYTVESGAMRFFVPVFIDANTSDLVDKASTDPRIFYYLAFDRRDKSTFDDVKKKSNSDLFVYCESPAQLQSAVLEAIALKKIQTDSSELQQDPIATREFSERMHAATVIEKDILKALTSDLDGNDWYFRNRKVSSKKMRSIQPLLSEVLKQVYPASPVFKNELINRDRPSAQAVAARTKLMEAMLLHGGEKHLGFEKFPAEKAMYLALLEENKLHRKLNGEIRFTPPPPSNESLSAVWLKIELFMKSTEAEAKSFVEINNELLSPPYGIKAGVLPILYLAYYLANEHEIAVFESRRYAPVMTPEMLERFVKRPDDYTFQLFKISGLKASLFKQYSMALFNHEDAKNVLDVVKPLASFMGSLPGYTKKTKRGLSKDALALRNAFDFAKSPEHLVFEKLPEALGMSSFKKGKVTKTELEDFSTRLRGCLSELKNCYDALLEEQKAILAQSLGLDSSEALAEVKNYAKHWYGLEKFTADGKELGGFITRLTKTDAEPQNWLENVLMFLVHKQPKDWLDGDRDEAEFRLHNLASRTLELQKMKQASDNLSESKDHYDFYFLKSIKQGDEDFDRVVSVNGAAEKRISSLLDEFKERLQSELTEELQVALVARLSNELLKETEDSKKERKRSRFKVVKKNE